MLLILYAMSSSQLGRHLMQKYALGLVVPGIAGNKTPMCRLTSPLGEQMAELPLDPRLARALLASCQAGCSEEVVTVVAMLSVQTVWFAGNGFKALDEAKAK